MDASNASCEGGAIESVKSSKKEKRQARYEAFPIVRLRVLA